MFAMTFRMILITIRIEKIVLNTYEKITKISHFVVDFERLKIKFKIHILKKMCVLTRYGFKWDLF